MRAILPVLGAVLLTAVWHPAAAQAARTERSLTLDDAIRLGMERNAAHATARASSDAAQADVQAAQGAVWPRLMLEAEAHRSDQPVVVFGDKLSAGEFTADDFELDSLNHPDPVNHLLAAVTLEAPLYTGGRTRWAIEAARRGADTEKAILRLSESDLAARITEAYFGVTLARAAVDLAEAARSSAAGHESVALARVQAGAALKSDFLRAKVFRLNRENDLDRRRADLALAASRLAVLVGLEPGETPDPVTPLEEPAEPLGAMDAWVARALSGAPLVAARREAAGAAAAQAGAIASERSPEVAALARYERNAGDFSWGEGAYLVGLSLRWAAFDRGRASRISSAEARRLAAESSSRAAEDDVRLAVEEAFHQANTASRSVMTAREAVAAAAAARDIAASRYAEGLLPLTELLDVESDVTSARYAEVGAVHAAVVGRARLALAAGSLEVPR